MSLKKQFSRSSPWIIHGFNGNQQIAERLLQENIYLSFGENLTKSEKLQKIFSQIQINCLFIETDVSDFPIEELYKKAAALKNISLQTLCGHIHENAKSIHLI